MSAKHQRTAVFIERVNDLISSGTYKNKRAIVEKLGWEESVMSNVMGGRRDVPLDVFQKLEKLFNEAKGKVNSEAEDSQDKYIASLEETKRLTLDIIELQKGTIARQEQEIAELKKRIDELSKPKR